MRQPDHKSGPFDHDDPAGSAAGINTAAVPTPPDSTQAEDVPALPHAVADTSSDTTADDAGSRSGAARAAIALAAVWAVTLVALAVAGRNDTSDTSGPGPSEQVQRDAPPASSSPTGPAQSSPLSITPAVPHVGPGDLSQLPRTTTFTTLTTAPREPAHPDGDADGMVVSPRRTMPLFDRPGGSPFAALPTRQLGGRTWVPVVEHRRGWVRVLLPSRPNRSSAWLPHNRALRVAHSPYRIVVDRDTFRLTLYRGWLPLGIWTVGIGKPSTPTPRGRTFVLAALREPRPTFSKVIVPLGAHSDTHQNYGGGPGTVGIHTWPTDDVYGQASSDGCIRVPSDALTDISTTVPIGTPVLIR